LKTIIIGGTFNPIHNGHLHIINELKEQLAYQRIIFIPSNLQAHKSSLFLVPIKDRIEMVKLAIENSPAIIDLCEIERGGISFMIDTVNTIKEKYNISSRIGLFIGDDLILGMKNWHNIEELQSQVDIIVAHRDSNEELETNLTHNYLNNISMNISSTDIRNRIKKGREYKNLIPEKVYKYIIEKELYI
jgi:nicotinate-nucleotide adenylyltransferase